MAAPEARRSHRASVAAAAGRLCQLQDGAVALRRSIYRLRFMLAESAQPRQDCRELSGGVTKFRVAGQRKAAQRHYWEHSRAM